MKSPRILVFISALVLIGCHYWPQQTTDPPAKPCPNPNVDTKRWPAIAMPECGIILQLPGRYQDQYAHPMHGDSFQHDYGNRFDSIHVFFTREEDAELSKNRAAEPEDYGDYSSCTETIGDHVASITTYRDTATIRGKTRNFRPYVTEARWQLGADEFLRIEAANATRHSQEEILTALRSVQFIPRSWPISRTESVLSEYMGIISGLPIQLTAYALVIVGGAYLIFRRKARMIPITNRRRRASIALYFALILTPSVLTDFFLFSAPAPALLALFVMLPSLFYIEFWWGKAYATLVLYIVPILVAFVLLYGLLSLYARFRVGRTASLSKIS